MESRPEPLAFHFTPLASAAPLLVFLIGAMILVVAGAPAVEGMILAGFACLIHGLLLFLFVKTGSATINTLHTRMVTNRRVKPADEPPALRQAS